MLIFILFVIFIIYLLCDKDYKIEFYVISLKKNKRLKNIKNQLNNINYQFVDAIDGKTIDQDELLNNYILKENFYDKNNNKRNKEIGCYQSHYKIYNQVKKKYNNYTVILEDDIYVNTNNLEKDLDEIINKMKNIDFDIIFLGNTFDNKGKKINGNIYEINKNKETVGCFAYLINNRNIQKFINFTKTIDEPIDLKLNSLIKTDNLKGYTISPCLINYKKELKSNINN